MTKMAGKSNKRKSSDVDVQGVVGKRKKMSNNGQSADKLPKPVGKVRSEETIKLRKAKKLAAKAKKKNLSGGGGGETTTVTESENAGPEVSGKKKKKDKAVKPKKDHVHESKGKNKALRYLDTWSGDRSNWKFEKCRQIWLLQNGYDDAKIPDEKFDALLSYMGSIQGKMRDITLGNAKEVIELDDKWQKLTEEGKTDAEIATILSKPKSTVKKLERAREIVEMLS